MSIQSPVGTLDIKNATLRVGKLEVSNIQGVDTALNVTRANSVLIYDDQVSTTTFNGFTSSGVRDTGNGYLDVADGYVYWGQKLPNSWVMDFEMDIRSGTNGGPLYANVFSTTNTGGDVYSFTFNDSNNKISLYYDSTLLTETTVSGLFTASEDWQKVVINYERGLIAISLDGSRKFYYKDIERETPYVNGEYVSFSSASTDGRKIRDLRIVNGEKWVYSGESNVVYTQGSVGIGVTDPTAALDVSGTVKATVFDGDGSAITNISSANVGDFASNVVRIENLETSNGHIWSNLASNVTTLRGEIDSNLATARADLQSNVTILRDEIDSNLATARTDLQSNVTILRGEIDSNLATARTDLQSNVTILRGEIDSNLATARTDLQSNVTILRGEIDSNLATARTDLQSNVTILRDEIDSNLATARTDLQSNVTILRDTAITFTGTKTFQDDVVLESNLRVQGDLLVANTVNMTVSDPILELGSNNLNTGDVGLVMTRHGDSNSNVAIFFDETADILKLGYTLNGANDTTLEFDSNALAVSVQGALYGEIAGSNTITASTIYGEIAGSNTIAASTGTFSGDFEVGTANLFVDTTTSNVGVGTDAPAYKLDVLGSANVGTLNATLTYSNASANIVAWNTSTNEVIDSGLERGFTEHPVVPLTGSTTYNANIGTTGEFPPSTHYVEGHGTYEAWASTQYNVSGQATREVWRLFDGSTSTYFQQGAATNYDWYNASSPYEYVGTRGTTTTDVGGTRYMGVWVQLKLPYTITLAYTKINNWTDDTNRSPGAGVILGSNDGDNWYKLTEFSGLTYTSNEEIVQVNATTPYRYYRMVATNTVGSLTLNFTEWRLFAEKPVTRMQNVHISGDLSSETLQTGYIKWPRVQLKANESEGYVASASSVYNSDVSTAPYTAFNNYREVKSNGYADAFLGGNGNFTSGVANTSRTTGTDTFNHEWLQIQMPRAITLSYFTLLQRVKNVDNDNDMPKNGRMYGSNDGISWTKLVTFSDLTYERFEETRVQVNSTTPYSYYRLAVTETVGDAAVYVAVGELQLFEAATGVGAAPTSAKLQVAGSLGLAKGSQVFAGSDVITEFPAPTRVLKYPRVNMTGLTTGIYTASASENITSITNADKAFDGNPTVFWHSLGSFVTNQTYSGSTSITDIEGIEHFGVWLKIDLGEAIKLQYFTMYPRITFERRGPYDGQLLGSNDGTNWYRLTSFQGLRYENYKGTRVDVNSGSYFKQYALIIQKTGDTNCQVSEWELYGIPQSDPEATGVDIIHRSIINKPNQDFLEVYWDANDSNSYSFADSDAVYDLSGNGVTGTITGTNGFDAEYNAWVFDGSGDYVSGTLPSSATGN